MTPVAVDIFIDTEPDRHTRVVLPRAYIMTASGYNQRTHPVLPESMRTSAIELNLMWPDAKPYSVALQEERRAKPQPGANPVADLRVRRIHVVVRRIAAGGSMEGFAQSFRREPFYLSGQPYDGLEHWHNRPVPGSSHYSYDYYFGEPDRDEFIVVSCLSKSHPIYFCDYDLRVSPDLSVKAAFLDFRLHGGRSFANERVALVRRALCAFVPTCHIDYEGR